MNICTSNSPPSQSPKTLAVIVRQTKKMIKRFFDILTFPFYLTYLFISFPYKIAKIIIDNKTERSGNLNAPRQSKTGVNDSLKIGQLLYPENYKDYETWINSYTKDKKKFIAENQELLKRYDNFEIDKIKTIEVIYIFGDSKQKICLTDWRGEENEREIEYFCEHNLNINIDWKNVKELRKIVDNRKYSDGKFAINLLKTIDKDLDQLDKRLVFFNLGWDAYIFTVVDRISHKTITDNFSSFFYGTEKLCK